MTDTLPPGAAPDPEHPDVIDPDTDVVDPDEFPPADEGDVG